MPPVLSAPVRSVGLGLLILSAAGCTRAEVSRAIFEALQAREELVNPAPPTRPAARRLEYSEYEGERQRLSSQRASGAAAPRHPDR